MVMMMEVDVMLATRHRLRRDRFCAVRSRLRIAGRLLYAARCRLSLCRRCRRFLGRRIRACRSLISLVRRVDGALFRTRFVRRTSREQRKGQDSPGKTDQF
jgi:hypothetical protein